MHTHNPTTFAKCLLLSFAMMLAMGGFGMVSAAARTLVVEAGSQDRVSVPMSIDAPADAKAATMTADGKAVECQVADGRLWFILADLPAGKTASFEVEFKAKADAKAGADKADGVQVKQADKQVDISIAGKPFTSYIFGNPKIGRNQLRRPCFWPVHGPGQVTMTRPYPMQHENLPAKVATDHPHHTSIWVAHGDVNKVDNWSISSKAGWQVHKSFSLLTDGPVVGIIRETLDWTDADKKPNLAETRTVRVYNLPDTGRVMDIELTFKATCGKVTFGDTKEGGPLAMRTRPEFRSDKRGDKGVVINSQGNQGGAAWGKKARWVDCSGMVAGKRYGLAMFDAPGNLRHPQTWHARTYGLCAINPFGLHHFNKTKGHEGDWTIEAGQSATMRYRIYFHAGDAKAAGVEARWNDYAKPPKATWK